jgi:UvrD-like helicase C-terminal domain/UvrD/REP helicase N-terminal domain
MKRPFLTASIDDLENALETAIAAGNEATIDAIAFELNHRRVPRAKDLADRIATRYQKLPGVDWTQSARSGNSSRSSTSKPSQTRTTGEKRKPTAQQQQAIDAFGTGGSLRVNAFAGSGKTSTLQMLSHSTSRRGQYIAFNKAIVADAKEKFPSTVDCSTTHALAFRATPQAFKDGGITKMTDRLGAQKLAEILGLKKVWRIDRDHTLQPRSQAYLIIETVRRFAQSADDEISEKHVPQHGSLITASTETLAVVKDFARRGAAHVWARMCTPADELPLGHDGYLKLWALARPQIAADFILLDEAQDTNPVVLEVLRRQQAQLVYVGDRWQQIYEWRGAVNAMESMQTDHAVSLTQSFRFGAAIASEASNILQRLGETEALVGNPALSSRVGPCTPDTILARTNANVMKALIDALQANRIPHLVGGTGELMEMLRGVADLKDNLPCNTVPDLFGFENWQQVLDFSKTQEGEHLVTFVNLVETLGERRLMWALNRSVDEDKADLVLSTAHKAKGREWDNVQLTDDFLKSRPAKSDRPEDTLKRDQEYAAELRLLYVAITRARLVIDIPPALAEMIGATVSQPVTAVRATSDHVEKAASPKADIPGWNKPVDWQPSTIQVSPVEPQSRPKQQKGFLARLLGL